LEIEDGENEIAGERGGGDRAGRETFAAIGAGGEQDAKKKRGEDEAAEEAGGAGFGEELERCAVELEDVFDAAVELGAVTWKNERGGAGSPAQQRTIGAHEKAGVGHRGALPIA